MIYNLCCQVPASALLFIKGRYYIALWKLLTPPHLSTGCHYNPVRPGAQYLRPLPNQICPGSLRSNLYISNNIDPR